MPELPLADATPLRITGTLFKDLVFAFQPQDIPEGATTLRALRRNGAIIVDEMEDASIILVDPEHPSTPDLLREAATKAVLHYSWVNKSLNAGRPLLESSNWGDCRVTPDNINNDFGYVPPPPPSNPQLQTPRPTPENRSYDFSMQSRFSQGSTAVTPPSSQPPHTPTPSHWPLGSTMLQQQTPQLPPANQIAPYNSQLMQPPSMFSPFPGSQPTDMGAMTHGQQPAWSPFHPVHPGPYNMVQPPTLEDFRRAYEVMMMWFQRPAVYPQLPPPPPPIQPNPVFHPPPPPPTQNPPSLIRTQSGVPKMPVTSASTVISRQDSIDSSDTFPDPGDLPSGPPPGPSHLSACLPIQSEFSSSPLPDDITESPMMATPLHTHPRLFEHAIGKPIMFCVPIILKNRGKLAEIFRATGGGFTEDVEDADYVVLGQWEEHFFDEMWYGAQDCNKPTVTPAFVIDSYENGKLMDPNNYVTRGPEKARKDEPRRARPRPATGGRRRRGRGRGRGGSSVGTSRSSPLSTPSEEAPKWLRFFKEAEHAKSLQYIGAMFKKNAELTYDALAIHLHNKMSNHTVNSWKKYCTHRTDAIEDLRRRAISNAEKKATPKDKDMADATREMLPIPREPTPRKDSQQDSPQEANPQQADPQPTAPPQTVPHPTTPHPADSQKTIPQRVTPLPTISQPTAPQPITPQPPTLQQAIPQPILPERATPQPTFPQQAVPQLITPQQEIIQSTSVQQVTPPQAADLHSSQPPPPHENGAKPELVSVKTEPQDEDQLDFMFATEVLSNWKPEEETDAALWKRMETMRSSATASSWEAFCEKHWSRFEHFFMYRSPRT